MFASSASTVTCELSSWIGETVVSCFFFAGQIKTSGDLTEKEIIRTEREL
jgi:hypothetical protein